MATRFYSNVEYGSSSRGNNDPDIIYYNATIVNNNIANDDPNGYNGIGNNPQDAQVIFNDQRQLPILQNASEYNMSVIRFDLAGATKSLPLFIPRVVPGQANVDLTIYNMTVLLTRTLKVAPFTETYYNATGPIVWIPENNTGSNTPPSPIPQQVFNSDYYFCQTYSHWAYCINQTMINILTALGVNYFTLSGLTLPAGIVNQPPPNLFYNPVTKLFSWSFDARYWGQDATDAGDGTYKYTLRFAVDTNLETLLTNFITYYSNGNTAKWGLDSINEIVINNQQIAIDTDPTTGQAYSNPNATGHVRYVITQDYGSTSGNWSPIDSICITTTKLPVYPEVVAPAPGTFGNSDFGLSNGTSGAAFQYIIADIQCGLTGADEWRQYIEYEPKAEYKVLSLNKSQEPIQNLDFWVWWRCRYDNNLYPLRLYNGSAVSLKLMFRRRFI